MKLGDAVTLLVDRDGYMVRTPAPYDEAAAREHLDAIADPAIVARLSVVTLVVADVRPAETRAERDTDPAPPMSGDEYSKLVGGGHDG